jgi:hypothetical protein
MNPWGTATVIGGSDAVDVARRVRSSIPSTKGRAMRNRLAPAGVRRIGRLPRSISSSPSSTSNRLTCLVTADWPIASICEAFEKLPSLATMQKLLSSLISKAIPLNLWVPALLARPINWVVNGLPECFPKLKVIWIESGPAWIPWLMQRLDHEFRMRTSEAPSLKRLPSEYMRDMFYSTQPMEMVNNREALELTFKMINAETQLLYSSDYPHRDMALPSTIWDRPFLKEQAKRNILGLIAKRIFNLDGVRPISRAFQDARHCNRLTRPHPFRSSVAPSHLRETAAAARRVTEVRMVEPLSQRLSNYGFALRRPKIHPLSTDPIQ